MTRTSSPHALALFLMLEGCNGLDASVPELLETSTGTQTTESDDDGLDANDDDAEEDDEELCGLAGDQADLLFSTPFRPWESLEAEYGIYIWLFGGFNIHLLPVSEERLRLQTLFGDYELLLDGSWWPVDGLAEAAAGGRLFGAASTEVGIELFELLGSRGVRRRIGEITLDPDDEWAADVEIPLLGRVASPTPYVAVAADEVHVYAFVAGPGPHAGLHVFDVDGDEEPMFFPEPSVTPTVHASAGDDRRLGLDFPPMITVEPGFAYVWIGEEDDDRVLRIELETGARRTTFDGERLLSFAVSLEHLFAEGVRGVYAFPKDEHEAEPIVSLSSSSFILAGSGLVADGDGVYARSGSRGLQWVPDATLEPEPAPKGLSSILAPSRDGLVWTERCGSPPHERLQVRWTRTR